MADVRERGSSKAAEPKPGSEAPQGAGWLDRVNAFGERNARPIIIASTVLVIVTVLVVVDAVNKQYQLPRAERERAEAKTSKDLQELKEKYRSSPVLPQIVLSLGHQLYKENKLDEARKEYEEFASRWPDHPLKEIAIRSKQKIDENLKYSETAREAALHAPELEVHPLSAAKAGERIRAIKTELKSLKDKTDAESKEKVARLNEELARLGPYAIQPVKEPSPVLALKLKSGVMRIELLEDEAPNAVAQIVDLVNKKYFDGLKFKVSDEELRLAPGEKAAAGTLAAEPSSREGEAGVVVLVRRPDGKGNLAGEFSILLQDRALAKDTVVGILQEGGLMSAKLVKADDTIEAATLEGLRDHDYKPAVQP